jgi:plasmid stability protein
MHTTDDERAVNVRVPGPMANALRELAAANYHSLSAEARNAFAAHIAARERMPTGVLDRTADPRGEVRG